jgi:positive regulator of sigma E activity
MDYSGCIGQKGVIEEISDGKVSVNITRTIACEGCHAIDTCTMFDSPARKIIVSDPGNDFHIGEEVNVFMKRSMGWKATLLAYFLPFVIMLTILIILNNYRVSELTMGLSVLCVLALYFLCLYFLKDRLKRTFNFILTKIT